MIWTTDSLFSSSLKLDLRYYALHAWSGKRGLSDDYVVDETIKIILGELIFPLFILNWKKSFKSFSSKSFQPFLISTYFETILVVLISEMFVILAFLIK